MRVPHISTAEAVPSRLTRILVSTCTLRSRVRSPGYVVLLDVLARNAEARMPQGSAASMKWKCRPHALFSSEGFP